VKINIAKTLCVLLFCLSVNTSLTASAVSYQPPLFHRHEVNEVFLRGNIVYLFQSGTADVRSTIHVNDILVVDRIDSLCRVTVVGKIRILSFVGETYLRGVVVDGEIKRDDIAKKDNVSCLVISAGFCNHQPH
jgi:hypothetical protein